MFRVLNSARILSLVSLGLALSATTVQAQGQGGGGGGGGGGIQIPQGAGVVVSPDGVLRMKQFDANLTKRRIQAAKNDLPQQLAKPSKLRKISLRQLEAVIAQRLDQRQGLTDEIKFLAGLTRITHVFVYPDSGDIVIAGPAEGFAVEAAGRPVGITTGRSVLELQDLIVALRAFPPSGQKTPHIGVSIDPTREGLARMQQFLGSLRSIRPNDANRIAFGLRQSLGLQMVTVTGISPKTHFAQVLVEADYRMKLIGIGLEKPPVKIASYVSKANPRDVARNAMCRWYFTPNYECLRVSDDQLAMELVGNGVKLVGADEVVRANGQRVGGAAANRASKIFCQSFTARYGELARRSPVYAQMRNLIDMSIAAAFMQEQDYYGKAGWRMEVLNDETRLPVEIYVTPKQVETAVNVIWKGLTLMTPIGGGVEIQPSLALNSTLSDDKGVLQNMRREITIAPKQWWWD